MCSMDLHPIKPGLPGPASSLPKSLNEVVDVRIVRSSGYNQFDLAALRAVQEAAPLPPLPRSYRQGSLGVNLIVR